MKQVKIAYAKCKAKMPNRPPDEIDFGLGFRMALEEVLEQAKRVSNGRIGIMDWIEKELE